MNDKKAILTTVSNFKLYEITSSNFPSGVQKYVIDGRKGMYGIDSIFYMMKKMKKEGVKWLIMADEDVIFINSDIVHSIIKKMEDENVTVCGIRDGGIINHRNFNPYVINTFFSILNLEEVYKIWDKKDILKNQYILENEFSDNLVGLKFDYNPKSLYEPYYCFYLWLRRNQKAILFLDSQTEEDGITNAVLYQRKIFIYHTWYARSYGVNVKHTKRINNFIALLDESGQKFKQENIIIFKSATFNFTQELLKTYRRILNKIFNFFLYKI